MHFQLPPPRFFVDASVSQAGFLESIGLDPAPGEGSASENPEVDQFDRTLTDALGLNPVPVPVHPAALRNHRPDFWRRWFLVDHAGRSQYDHLREATSDCSGIPEPTVCLALRGEEFHGQHGRGWHALAGNLHLSLGIPCNLDVHVAGPVLPALPVVAVCEAIEELGVTANRPGIKWVNDVLIGGRKVAGMLTSVRSRNGRVESIFIGVGVNVLSTPDLDREDRYGQATSLAAESDRGDVDLAMVIPGVLNAVAARFERLRAEGPASLLDAYRQRSVVIGKEVVLRPDPTDAAQASDTSSVRGRVSDISGDLGLIVEGYPDPILSGRLEPPE